MNQSKTYFVYSLLLALALGQQTLATTRKLGTITTEPQPSLRTDDFDDLFDIAPDDIDDEKTQQLVDQRPTLQLRTSDACTPQQTIDFIIGFFGSEEKLKKALQQDVYYHTNPINTRSLLDNPLFITRLFHAPHKSYASVDLFWNETNRANFTKDSNKICSYLAVNNEELFKLLPSACEQYTLTIFPILANGRLEERRVGGMLQAGHRWNRFTLRGMAPFYYLERNYQLKQAEKDALMVQFGDVTEDEQERFQRDHMISDSFGLGDLRLYGDIHLVEKPMCHLSTGPLITLPTAFAFVHGIIGTHHKTPCQRPTINLQDNCACILERGDFSSVITEMESLGFSALNELSSIILEESLGNRHHLGLGGFLDWDHKVSTVIKRPWADFFTCKNYISFEYLIPGNETRYFVNYANIADYDARNFEDESQAADNLHFIETELIDTVFPYHFKTYVQPGCIFWWDSQIAYQKDRIGLSGGLDFWFHSKEKLSSIHTPIPRSELAISTAHAPLAYQIKMLGSYSYTLDRETHEWVLGFGADKTFASAGVGKDYTVNAFLRTSF